MNEIEIDYLKKIPINKLTSEDLLIKEVFDHAIRQVYTQGELKNVLQNSPINYLQPYMYDLVKEGNVDIDYVPKVFLEDYELAMLFAEEDVSNIVSLPEKYRDDEDFIFEMTFTDGRVLHFASDRLKNSKKIIDSALKNTVVAFRYIPENLKTEEYCLLSLSGRYAGRDANWKLIPKELALDKDFIKKAGELCPKIYEHLDPRIKHKDDIVEYFLEKDHNNIVYLCNKNKNNINFVRDIVEKNPYTFSYLGDKLKNDPDLVLSVIKNDPSMIFQCGDEIKSNKEIAKYICNLDLYKNAISFFNEEIKADKEIAMISILRSPASMKNISTELMADKEFILSYMKNEKCNILALSHISEELRNDVDIMKEAYHQNNQNLGIIGEKLKHDEEFLNYIFSEKKETKDKTINNGLRNLKFLSVGRGDEDVLLSFHKNIDFNIDNVSNQHEIFNRIDTELKLELKEIVKNNTLSDYLNSITLKRKLNNELTKKEPQRKKLKI